MKKSEADAAQEWREKVAEARDAYTAEHTFTALKLYDAELYGRLFEQVADFERATVIGTALQIAEQGAATVRGYQHCSKVLDGHQWTPTAILGDGFMVVAKPGRFKATNGEVVLTTDDIAELLKLPGVLTAVEAMRQWPGARLIAMPDRSVPDRSVDEGEILPGEILEAVPEDDRGAYLEEDRGA